MKLSEYFGPNYEFAEKQALIVRVHALVVAESLSGWEAETLEQAWRLGQMESGDTPCKGARAYLLHNGLLCQTCWKGNDYTFSVTYPLGFQVLRALSVVE